MLPAQSSGQADYLAIMEQPLIRSLQPLYGRFLRGSCKIEKIPSETFSLALLEYLGTYKQDDEFLLNTSHETIKIVLKQIEPILSEKTEIDSDDLVVTINNQLEMLLKEEGVTRLLTQLHQILAKLTLLTSEETEVWQQSLTRLSALVDLFQGTSEMQLDALRAGIAKLQEGSKAKESLLSIVDLNIEDVDVARQRIEKWFDESMENAGGLFKRYTRTFVIISSFFVTFLIGGSTFDMAQSLAQQPVELDTIVNIFSTLSAVDPSQLEPEKQANIVENLENLETAVTTITDFGLPIPWWQSGISTDPGEMILTIIGLLITWAFVSQGSSFWYDILKLVKGDSSGSNSGQSASDTQSTS